MGLTRAYVFSDSDTQVQFSLRCNFSSELRIATPEGSQLSAQGCTLECEKSRCAGQLAALSGLSENTSGISS